MSNQNRTEGKALSPDGLEDKAVTGPAAAPATKAEGVEVVLAHPYTIDGKEHPVNATVTVDAQTARLLRAAGYAKS